jgi:hypothetical protein
MFEALLLTAETHRSNIMQKLELHSVTKLDVCGAKQDHPDLPTALAEKPS